MDAYLTVILILIIVIIIIIMLSNNEIKIIDDFTPSIDNIINNLKDKFKDNDKEKHEHENNLIIPTAKKENFDIINILDHIENFRPTLKKIKEMIKKDDKQNIQNIQHFTNNDDELIIMQVVEGFENKNKEIKKEIKKVMNKDINNDKKKALEEKLKDLKLSLDKIKDNSKVKEKIKKTEIPKKIEKFEFNLIQDIKNISDKECITCQNNINNINQQVIKNDNNDINDNFFIEHKSDYLKNYIIGDKKVCNNQKFTDNEIKKYFDNQFTLKPENSLKLDENINKGLNDFKNNKNMEKYENMGIYDFNESLINSSLKNDRCLKLPDEISFGSNYGYIDKDELVYEKDMWKYENEDIVNNGDLKFFNDVKYFDPNKDSNLIYKN